MFSNLSEDQLKSARSIAESLIDKLVKQADEHMDFASSDEWPLMKLSEMDGRGRSSIQKILSDYQVSDYDPKIIEDAYTSDDLDISDVEVVVSTLARSMYSKDMVENG